MVFKKEVRFADHGGAYAPGIQDERSGQSRTTAVVTRSSLPASLLSCRA